MDIFKHTRLMAMAMSLFFLSTSLPTQSKAFAKDEAPLVTDEEVEVEAAEPIYAPAERKLNAHGLGIGLGQTFLMGNYGDHGDDEISLDFFYSYSVSYSFDLIVNTHYSSHEDDDEKLRIFSLNSSIKSRLFEFDNFSPFIQGGLGFYMPKAKRYVSGSLKNSKEKIVFGANLGSGIDLRLNQHYVVGLLGQFHWPFNSEQNGQPDLKGYYFKLLLTASYIF